MFVRIRLIKHGLVVTVTVFIVLSLLNEVYFSETDGQTVGQTDSKKIYHHGRQASEDLSQTFQTPSQNIDILQEIRKLIINPRERNESLKYNLSNLSSEDFSRGQSTTLDEFFNYKENGFFVELGAGDGETQSVSLMLERDRSWQGLLVEPSPVKHSALLKKRRRSSLLQACVKTGNDTSGYVSWGQEGAVTVPCFSPGDILLATGREEIDVLCVDVNGKEAAILESLPLDRIRVKAITVELHGSLSPHSRITRLLIDRGYRSLKLLSDLNLDRMDVVYVLEDA